MNNVCFISFDWFFFIFGMKVLLVKGLLIFNVEIVYGIVILIFCFVFFCYLVLFLYGGFDSKWEEN